MLSKKFAEVDPKVCVACGACRKECPREAIQIWRGCYARIDKRKCVGCGKCAKMCPANCIELCEREDRNEDKKMV